jgi:ABC-type multidrug transport system fused ATPase/permease subunit
VREVSFELRPGMLTAIVGPSGAGKSTLIRVLLRFVEPQAGRVLLNGRASGDMTAAEWRRHIALVSQRPRFLDGSILENLRIAQPEASLKTVRAAARMAQADAFVSALPAGYDTRIDDTASTLSGGERQRLAIARALLKRSPVLVLDEPSSSVDAETEEMLAATLARVARERTVLMVTHRAATLRHADTIIALEGGRVVDVRTEAA